MKKIAKIALALALVLSTVLALTACSPDTLKSKLPWNKDDLGGADEIWKTASYDSDSELGEGSKALSVRIEDTKKQVTFTIHTDKETVGEALFEHNLINGEEGAYGLYVKVANGVLADFDKDGSYWAFYIEDEYAMTGVEATAIEEGVLYRLVYTK